MRLIDADALMESLDNAIKDAKCNGEICDYWEDDRSNLLYYLDTAPTVDAVPLEQYRSMERTCYKLQKALYEMAEQTERSEE